MKLFKKFILKYSEFIAHNPFLIVIIALLITGVAFQQVKNVQMKSMDNEDMLPDNLEVMKAMDLLNNNFDGSNSAKFLVELTFTNQENSIKDIRDPKVIKYLYLLEETASHTEDVISAIGPGALLKNMNKGHIPHSLNRIKELEKENKFIFNSYINKDYSMALVKIKLSDDFDDQRVIKSLNKVMSIVPKPEGLIVNLAGETLSQPIIQPKMSEDSMKTSLYSIIGIIFILLILFRSIKYSFIPLMTIGMGVIWAIGYIGLINMAMSPATSGVFSMIMGIGIDFGIQTVTRFRQELKYLTGRLKVEKAIIITLNNVIIPMATTTFAALIGFKAMSMGKLTMMAEMGTMMSFGITACFLVAITVVPSLLVIFEKYKLKKFWRK